MLPANPARAGVECFVIEFQQIAAALYLAAGLGAMLGIVLADMRISRGAAWGLALGAGVQTVGFATLHRLDPVPPLTGLPVAVSAMAWMAVIALLVLMWRVRLTGMAAGIGPIAFLAVFLAARGMADPAAPTSAGTGSIPHAHVLLSSGGLALLGIAGMAGLFFLAEHRRLKQKLPSTSFKMPSLEALDRVNVATLAIGFPLLTLGVLTGAIWVRETSGGLYTGSHHEMWTMIAWAIYLGLVVARFIGNQGGRQAAASAVAGFAFLIFAVVGVEMVA